MESPTWPESLPSNMIKAIHELAQGHKFTNNLLDMLMMESDPTYEDDVVVQIMSMFENTLSILGSSSSKHNLQNIPITSDDFGSTTYSSDEQKSENSAAKSVGNVIPVKFKKGCNKRRKNSRTSSLTSTLVDDGHAWRKYGQKQIHNTKHQRSYYRCTYKFDQGCLAAKQVQMIQDNPPKYKTTYIGNHTCNNLQRAPQIILDSQSSGDSSILINFGTKEFIGKRQVGAYTPSIKHELKKGYPSQGNLRHNQYSYSSNYQPCDLNACGSHNSLETIHDTEITSGFYHGDMMSSMVHSGLDDHHDMISSRAYSSMNSIHDFEMDHILRMNDVNDFPSQFSF